MWMASAVFIAIIALSFFVALLSRRNHAHQNTQDFFAASGQFGGLLVFLLTVGETYSIGSIMGFPAAAWHEGIPFVGWFLGYIVLAYPVGYFLNPLIWKAGRRENALTFADLFRSYFSSRFLEVAVTLSAILFLLPLGELQMAGLIATIGEFHWPFSSSVIAGGCAVLTFSWLALSGVRAPAFVSAIKDSIVILAIVFISIAVLYHSSWHALVQASRAMPLATQRDNMHTITTILIQALGFCVAPQTIPFVFTARSASIVRRNQILMPLYMLMFPLLLLCALYASAVNLPLSGKNTVFIDVAMALLPAWGFGLVTAACALSGLVVLAGVCLCIGSLVSRNLMHGLPDTRQKNCAKVVITLYLVFCVYTAMRFSALMPVLTTVYYLGVVQLFPAVMCIGLGLNVSTGFVTAGFLAGEVLAVGLAFFDVSVGNMNAGFIGLLLNTSLVALGFATRASDTVKQRRELF
ncbi:sodium:solute symporter family protein [Komagataeibacter medellinensis]|nr:sodium:solute symporter [Komagataeibacter medellinensis]